MNKGIPLIKKYEGLRLEAYLCPSSIPTIGYGNTFWENGSKVVLGEKISIERADSLLNQTVSKFEQQVKNLVKSAINENQLGALTSFAYNVGVGSFSRSTLLRKVNINPNDVSIRVEFMKWNKGGGKVLNGLTKRRKDEADLYFS